MDGHPFGPVTERTTESRLQTGSPAYKPLTRTHARSTGPRAPRSITVSSTKAVRDDATDGLVVDFQRDLLAA